MIKLKNKYFVSKKFNKIHFTIGNVLKIFYFIFYKKKKKMYKFIGFCFNKKNSFFQLFNIIKKEKIIISFDKNSPLIFKIIILNIYKKVIFRVSRLYCKKTNYYLNDYKNKENFLDSSLDSFKRDYFLFGFYRQRLVRRKKKMKKFRKKYSYTEVWKFLKIYGWEVKNYKYLDELINEELIEENIAE